MELLLVGLFLCVMICFPITLIIYIFRKAKGKDTYKQLKYLKRQAISYVVLIILFALIQSNNENNTSNDDVVAVSPTVTTESEEEYKLSCNEYNYKDVMRNPQDYVGNRIKILVEVYSVHEKSLSYPKYYFARSQDENGFL